jgi:hypothetical protein
MKPVQIFIALYTEGSTDVKFLTTIVGKTFAEIALECTRDISIEYVVDIKELKQEKGQSFVEDALFAINTSTEYGFTILCIHLDADAETADKVWEYKLAPLQDAIGDSPNLPLVPIVPIRMTEAWLLADKNLFKEKIRAKDLTDVELGIEKNPQAYANPKAVIENAIRVSLDEQAKRRRLRSQVSIQTLYTEIGNAIQLSHLHSLSSFSSFAESVRAAYQQLGYLF